MHQKYPQAERVYRRKLDEAKSTQIGKKWSLV